MPAQCDWCGEYAFEWRRGLGCDIGECTLCGRWFIGDNPEVAALDTTGEKEG